MSSFPTTRQSLVEGLCDTDEEAWRDFLEAYVPRLLPYFRKWSTNATEAEENCQQFLIRLFRHLPKKGSSFGKFRAYLLTVAHNTCKDECRKTSQRMELPLSEEVENKLYEDVRAATEELALKEAFARVQSQVSEAHWRVFRLRQLLGYSTRDVAQELCLQPGNVNVICNRVQNLIRHELR